MAEGFAVGALSVGPLLADFMQVVKSSMEILCSCVLYLESFTREDIVVALLHLLVIL